ncbi:MAG: D-alanyl-D-alanine carboxypeptidase family protein [Bacillota bacterium]|jgi:D-alanyl-D-alanine carboxypeptidase (penicillin-binding protein 5/6)
MVTASFFFLLLSVFDWEEVQAQPRITADSYILMEAWTGQVLLAKDEKTLRQPASTTKVLTAIVAIELGELDELVTVSKKAARVGEASLHLRPDEVFTLGDLVKGALIKSGNDATVAIAEQLAGDERLYLDLLNRKARLLGAWQTYFQNPHGLPHQDHLTTAYDLALLARYALKNPIFASIVGTQEELISSLNTGRIIYLRNTNRLLWEGPHYLGVKTGTTVKAGKCLIGAARMEGRTLISVVLHSDDRFGDTKKLMDYGMTDFQLRKIVDSSQHLTVRLADGKFFLTLAPEEDFFYSVRKGQQLSRRYILPGKIQASIRAGEPVGSLDLFLDGKKIKKVRLIALEDIRIIPWTR